MFEIKRPEGDPEMIRSQVKQLGTVAEDVDGWASILHTEQGAMLTAWPDTSGQRASAETGALSTKAQEYGGHLDAGIAALTTYADALNTAQTGVDGIQRQVETAHTERGFSYPPNTDHVSPSVSSDYVAAWEDLQREVSALEGPYNEIIRTWETAAGTCYQALLDASPGFRHGMTPRDMQHAVEAGLARDLPAAAAANQEKIEHAQDVADQVNEHIDAGEPIPEDLITQMESGANDPFFAVPFLHRLGPDRPFELAEQMRVLADNGQGDRAYNERVLGSLGRMIAVGTNEESAVQLDKEKWVDPFLARLDQHDENGVAAAWTLSDMAVAAGDDAEFGEDFLRQVGDKLYGLESGLAGDPKATAQYLSGPYTDIVGDPERYEQDDPTQWYFEEIASQPPVAQDFFSHSDRVKFYLTGRGGMPESVGDFDDHGLALGHALEAATGRDLPGNDKEQAAEIAKHIVNSLAYNSDPDFLTRWDHTALRSSVGNVLVDYASDINRSFLEMRGAEPNGVAHFDHRNLMSTMRLAFTDPDIEDRLGRAVILDQHQRMADAVFAAPDYRTASYEYGRHLDMSGRVLGAIYASQEGVESADAADADSQNKARGKVMGLLVDNTIGRVPGVGDVVSTTNALFGDAFFPDDHEITTIKDGLNNRGDAAANYADMSLPEGVYARLEDLYGAEGGGSVPLDADLDQREHFEDAFGNWGATQWDENGNPQPADNDIANPDAQAPR